MRSMTDITDVLEIMECDSERARLCFFVHQKTPPFQCCGSMTPLQLPCSKRWTQRELEAHFTSQMYVKMLRRYQELVTGVVKPLRSSSSSDIIDDININEDKPPRLPSKKKQHSDQSTKQRVAKLLDRKSSIHQIFDSTEDPEEPKTPFAERIQHDPVFDDLTETTV